MDYPSFIKGLRKELYKSGDFNLVSATNTIIVTTEVSTMATNGKNIFINPTWVDSLTVPEVVGVLWHELLHDLLNHHNARWAKYDPSSGISKGDWNDLVNVAMDVVINDYVRKQGRVLPESGAFREKLGIPPELTTSHRIFKRLLSEYKQKQEQFMNAVADIIDQMKQQQQDEEKVADRPQQQPDSQTGQSLSPSQGKPQDGTGKPQQGGDSTEKGAGAKNSKNSKKQSEELAKQEAELTKQQEELKKQQEELAKQQEQITKQQEELENQQGAELDKQSGAGKDESPVDSQAGADAEGKTAEQGSAGKQDEELKEQQEELEKQQKELEKQQAELTKQREEIEEKKQASDQAASGQDSEGDQNSSDGSDDGQAEDDGESEDGGQAGDSQKTGDTGSDSDGDNSASDGGQSADDFEDSEGHSRGEGDSSPISGASGDDDFQQLSSDDYGQDEPVSEPTSLLTEIQRDMLRKAASTVKTLIEQTQLFEGIPTIDVPPEEPYLDQVFNIAGSYLSRGRRGRSYHRPDRRSDGKPTSTGAIPLTPGKINRSYHSRIAFYIDVSASMYAGGLDRPNIILDGIRERMSQLNSTKSVIYPFNTDVLKPVDISYRLPRVGGGTVIDRVLEHINNLDGDGENIGAELYVVLTDLDDGAVRIADLLPEKKVIFIADNNTALPATDSQNVDIIRVRRF